MSTHTDRPWLALYDKAAPPEIELEHRSALAMFADAVGRAGDRAAIRYYDAELTWSEVDRLSDALAVSLHELGIEPGDRVGVYLQNVPQFLIAMVATWKAGAIMVSINPMYKARELREILEDSGATALVALEALYGDVAAGVVGDTDVRVVVTTSPLDFLDGDAPAALADVERHRHDGTSDLLELARAHAGQTPAPVDSGPDDIAFLTYTSGTTGPPKGAMNTNRNVVFNAQVYRDWMRLTEDDSVFGAAPLFHITGLIGHAAVAMLVPMPLVLFHRFDPGVALEQAERHRPTFTIAAITAFIALLHHRDAATRDLSSLAKVYSGGAPIPAATVETFEKTFGSYIHNIYGLTETTSPSHAVPLDRRAPVDESSGALSVGVPVFNTVVKIVGEAGEELPPGEVGEFVTSGPQVVPGYWQKPEETEHALPGGALKTGDVGFMDEDGWFYLVDRKKDQINASGYKVWPREVEDVLYAHPAVREAAVVGVPDEYRGETVKAFVSLKDGESADEGELIAFCKERMAAYKYPRQVEIIAEVPKTATGKILRRELRDNA
ncbi:MAG: long-chain acyl-CoA synthetase [Solirubrobacteraceae bacterium]|jgi:long-chain acyl-CoA synthetase|nr:long-chain acyl-CoA synthetase [Solirubrobacteraceae bacterium]